MSTNDWFPSDFDEESFKPIMSFEDQLYTLRVGRDGYAIFLNFEVPDSRETWNISVLHHHTFWHSSLELHKQGDTIFGPDPQGWGIGFYYEDENGSIDDWRENRLIAKDNDGIVHVLKEWYDEEGAAAPDEDGEGEPPSFEHIKELLLRHDALAVRTIIEKYIGGTCMSAC